jgi:hypothetical protein
MHAWTDNQEAYSRLRQEIDRRFPEGRFVAIESGAIIADAGRFRDLLQRLKALGKNPQDSLIVQAGVEDPESAFIFLFGTDLRSDA